MAGRVVDDMANDI